MSCSCGGFKTIKFKYSICCPTELGFLLLYENGESVVVPYTDSILISHLYNHTAVGIEPKYLRQLQLWILEHCKTLTIELAIKEETAQ